MWRYLEVYRPLWLAMALDKSADVPKWCLCGLCNSSWKRYGWCCDGTRVAYLLSGQLVRLGDGCRGRIAADCKVPPGFVGRRGGLMCIGPCSGMGCIPPELDLDITGRDIYRSSEYVPILPPEYYSGMIVDLMVRGLFIGVDGSVFAIMRQRIRPKVFHVREKRMGLVYALHGAYRIVFDSGYRSASFLLHVDLVDGEAIWLSHEVISTKPCSRSRSAVMHLQRRFRRPQASSCIQHAA